MVDSASACPTIVGGNEEIKVCVEAALPNKSPTIPVDVLGGKLDTLKIGGNKRTSKRSRTRRNKYLREKGVASNNAVQNPSSVKRTRPEDPAGEPSKTDQVAKRKRTYADAIRLDLDVIINKMSRSHALSRSLTKGCYGTFLAEIQF